MDKVTPRSSGDPSRQTTGSETRAAFGRRSIPAKQPVMKPARRSASDPSRPNSRWWNPRGVRPAIHPGQTAGDETQAAFGRRSIPAEPRRCAPLVVAFRSKYTRYSSLTRLVSRTPTGRTGPRPHRENWPASALTWVPPPAVHRVASRRSSLRFGRNTPGIPPSRALSAGPPPGELGLAPTGRTGRPRRSRGFHHRLNRAASLRSALRFGRNTPGIPPSRALSAGRLAPTGRTGRSRRSPGFHHRLLTDLGQPLSAPA